MSIAAESFAHFFRAVQGHPPFPWQTRLLHTVLAEGWPTALSLPTASGKTAVLDIAVFALACEAGLPAACRRTPRRVALVVDRRIVVDDAFERARRIARALAAPPDAIVQGVADALSSLGGELPLDVAQLRGGVYREDRWARTPAQPVILCSTVDQVGSRLLHRGYGLSPSMWPIHAGLLGNDCLIVLDEAHCSQPFLQTLDWIARFRAKADAPLSVPFSVVTMTATPRGSCQPLALDSMDFADPILSTRIDAKKITRLVEADARDDGFVRTCLGEVQVFAKPGTTTMVVVNRVAVARAIREEIERRKTARPDKRIDADAILLTGRCRPLERDNLLATWRHRLMAGRQRDTAKNLRPLVVVATQCVEVGADLDVDALVTECCAFDALRQRLGRLDRLGELGQSRAVVVCRPELVGKPGEPADDPVYGTALSRTWLWLSEMRGAVDAIDLGIAALDGIPSHPGILPLDTAARSAELAPLSTPTLDAPVLFPAYCDLWAQTGPEPAVSPEPAIFLHGPQRGEPDVRLVWRADLDAGRPDTWADTVSLCPPVSAESMPLPLSLARRWLGGQTVQDTGSDAEGDPTEADADTKSVSAPRLPVLRWHGPERSSLALTPVDIYPGDVLVLPAVCGGCDPEGWNPSCEAPVADLADAARMAARRPAALRLHPSQVAAETWGEDAARLAGFANAADEGWPEDIEERIWGALAALARRATVPTPARAIIETLLRAPFRRRALAPHPSGFGFVLSCDLRPAGERVDFTDEDDTSPRAMTPVRLDVHLADVAARTAVIAAAAGLPPTLAADLALAARLHDAGKADPRFQAWLAGGDPLRARHRGLLAKSEALPTSLAALDAARQRAGYPAGGRHELLSLRLAESADAWLAQAHDRDLVLHLIASHHGHCRPFAPVVFDDRPLNVRFVVEGHVVQASTDTGLERLDNGVAERFWILVRRYGWWGLAYLEACLRLADHRASESPIREETAQ